MHTSKKHPLPKNNFEALAKECQLNPISVYMPMDKKGKEKNMHLTQFLIRQLINKVKRTLAEHLIQRYETEKYPSPVMQLSDIVELWCNSSGGLIIFLDSKNGMRYCKVPIPLEANTYVVGHSYLSSLLPLYHNDGP